MATPAFRSFHDGLLIGAAVGDKRAVLTFRDYRGDEYDVKPEGVEALQIDDFRQGNIVLDLDVITGRDPRRADNDFGIIRLFGSSDKATPEYRDKHEVFLVGIIDRLKRGEATLVTVSPCYGADLVAYCASVSLHGPKKKG
jgi:hypothetical protein